MEFLGTHICAHIQRHIPQYSSSQSCCDTVTELMVFLLQCPRLPLNIHHWTLHGKLWPLAFTQTPSHSASRALIKQTTQCCLHSDPLSLHIKTHPLPLPLLLILFFFHSGSSLRPPHPAPVDLLPVSSQSAPPSACWPTSSSLHFALSVSLCCVMKRIWVATIAEGV